jgi:hypothetical protein
MKIIDELIEKLRVDESSPDTIGFSIPYDEIYSLSFHGKDIDNWKLTIDECGYMKEGIFERVAPTADQIKLMQEIIYEVGTEADENEEHTLSDLNDYLTEFIETYKNNLNK